MGDNHFYPIVEMAWLEDIQCPACGLQQEAAVEVWEGAQWPAYNHDCERCGAIITESEWVNIGFAAAASDGVGAGEDAGRAQPDLSEFGRAELHAGGEENVEST
jgi:hypothetical protein